MYRPIQLFSIERKGNSKELFQFNSNQRARLLCLAKNFFYLIPLENVSNCEFSIIILIFIIIIDHEKKNQYLRRFI